MGQMRVLSWRGDTKITWSAEKPDEVQLARAAFTNAMAIPGTRAYKLGGMTGRAKGEEITTFDPAAERIALVPAMQGG